jgi:endonuclease III
LTLKTDAVPIEQDADDQVLPAPVSGEAAPALSESPRKAVSSKKRKREPMDLKFNDEDKLPHNLGANAADITDSPTSSTLTAADIKEEPFGAQVKRHATKAKVNGKAKHNKPAETTPPTKSKSTRTKKAKSSPLKKETSPDDDEEAPKKKAKTAKSNTYGLKAGETPFPDWPHPTPEECHEVTQLLSKVHGEVKAPKTIPVPSLTVTGCGEVPSVLDALIRTRLSAATTGGNSARAFKGLVQTFGVLKEGIGKGSVDWDAVRRADVKEIFEAIKSGGLADTKSKDIKAILEMVYEQNQARRAALVDAEESKDAALAPSGAENESSEQKNAEIERAKSNVLSLDHLHSLSTDEAFQEMIKYPGIGPKTASCVLLFCLQRPSFAVDTHVFRLCTWLGWVPPTGAVNRNSTYAHCEVRIPDELKYPLHQLFIKHGKTCPRCRAATGQGSKGWDEGCVIDHLVTRTGARKTGVKASKGIP